MGHTFSEICYHIVFSTKGRLPLMGSDKSPQLHAYMAQIINNNYGKCHLINGMPNHVHILTSLKPSISISDVMLRLKGDSSRWANEKQLFNQKFGWQSGYGIFSVSHSNIDSVYKYISNQQEHHKKFDFESEFRKLLEKHNIKFDEKHIWG